MSRFEKIENVYLNFFRYSLIIVATLAIAFGLINFIISIAKIGDSPNRIQINMPTWSEIKFDVLPISKPKPVKKNEEEASQEYIEETEQVNIDGRIKIIIINLNALFASEKVKFSTYYGPRLLNEWVESTPINYRYKNRFLDGLVTFSEEIKNEKRIKQIGNLEDRVEIIFQSLELYLDNFLIEIQSTEIQNQELISESLEKNDSGYQQLINTGYALAGFIFILLIILIFKIEANLREISPAIQEKK